MPIPTTFNSVVTNPGGTGTTIVPTLPTHAAGDVIEILVGNTGNVTWTAPAGWTRRHQSTVGTSSTGQVGTLLIRRVLSGDTLPLTSPTCTLGATVTRGAIAITRRGADVEGVYTLPEWAATNTTTGTANPIRPPSVTTPAPDMQVYHYYVQRTATNAPEPSGYTQIQEIVISGTLVINVSEKNVADQQTVLSNQDASPTSGARWTGMISCAPSPDYPYHRSMSSATTASGTSVTPALPTGTTAADTKGNKDVLFATLEGSGATTLSMTDVAWTEITGITDTTSGGGSSVKKFWAYMSGTLGRQCNRTGTGELSAYFNTYHNCHQTSPIGAVNKRQNASSTTSTWDALSRTNTKVVMNVTCVADAVPTFTSPSGWTERMDGLGMTCADQAFNATGSTASAAFTLSSASPTLVGLVELIGIASVFEAPTVIPNKSYVITQAITRSNNW